MKAVIYGARRRRQGLGEFIARWLDRAGVDICAIVGTSPDTLAEAEHNLLLQHGISCRTYTSFAEALEKETPELAVICTPYIHHLQHLQTAAAYGVHTLCEKPLWWDNECQTKTATTKELIDSFERKNICLDLVTQWPSTIPFFYQIYPDVQHQLIEKFTMTLGPISFGDEMILDSMPHILSMLHALVGIGEVGNTKYHTRGTNASKVEVSFDFTPKSDAPICAVQCNFIQTEKAPRPAGYSINGHRIKRSIKLPQYDTLFEGENGNIVRVDDPLQSFINSFVTKLASKPKTDREKLVNGIVALEKLVECTASAV